ncbi:MAG: hypothetical protein ACI85I_001962, partial [Arenicella sp.]
YLISVPYLRQTIFVTSQLCVHKNVLSQGIV